MAAAVVLAEHQEITHARGSQVAQRDLARPAVWFGEIFASRLAWHGAIEARHRPESNCRLLVARNAREALPVVDVDNTDS